MSSPQRNSDTEGPEKPVRDKLRTTSIAGPSSKDGTLEETAAANERLSPRSTSPPSPPPPSERVAAPITDSNSSDPSEDDKARGRPSRKRSHEDITDPSQGEPAQKSRHGRKRSRDEEDDGTSPKRKTPEKQAAPKANGAVNDAARKVSTTNKRSATPAGESDPSATLPDVASPKTKKSRSDQTDTEIAASAGTGGDTTAVDDSSAIGPLDPMAEVDKHDKTTTVHSDQAKEKSKPNAISPISGFANASTASPFGSLASKPTPADQATSTSAFKSSGFGALAATSTSGFGSLAGTASKLSSFATSSTTPSAPVADAMPNNDKSSTKTFGGALGASTPFAAAGSVSASPFGSGASSGFGQIGKGGFGSGSGLGAGFGTLGGLSKLGSFASSGTPGVLGGGSKPARPFGAAADDHDEAEEGSGAEEEEGAEENKPDEDEKDERFFARDIETGEENETTEYTCRAKLYNFVKAEDGTKKEWKERGLGVVRLNVTIPGSDAADTAPKARLVMRADGSHRVALNTPIVKGVKFGSVNGEAPVGGYMYFMGSIDGSAKLEMLQMKLRPQFALELYDRIVDLQSAM